MILDRFEEVKKKYVSPVAEIEMFSVVSVVSTSGSQDDNEEEGPIF